jgi:hypothetical protein
VFGVCIWYKLANRGAGVRGEGGLGGISKDVLADVPPKSGGIPKPVFGSHPIGFPATPCADEVINGGEVVNTGG